MEKRNLTLAQIKTEIFGTPDYKLGVNYSTTLQEVDGEMIEVEDCNWLRHWNDEKRIAVSFHVETGEAIKANPNLATLDIQVEQRVGAKGAFTAYRIVNRATPPPVEIF